jgi:hypothetical protein
LPTTKEDKVFLYREEERRRRNMEEATVQLKAMQLSEEVTTVGCKALLGDPTQEVNEFELPLECTFEHLVGTLVLRIIGSKEDQAAASTSQPKLKYKDSDGDFVTFNTNGELKDALQWALHHNGQSLEVDASALVELLATQMGRRGGGERGRSRGRTQRREERQRRGKRQRTSILEELDEATRTEWQDMLKRLAEMGFDRERQNIKLMARLNLRLTGNTSEDESKGSSAASEELFKQVVAVLEERKQKRLARLEKRKEGKKEKKEKLSKEERLKMRAERKEKRRRKCHDIKEEQEAEVSSSSSSGSGTSTSSSSSGEERSHQHRRNRKDRRGGRGREDGAGRRRKSEEEEGYLKFDVDNAVDKDSGSVNVQALIEGSWPAGVTHLFLDGNNMLFIADRLRHLTLNRSTRHKAEHCLSRIAEAFTRAMNLKGVRPLSQTVMIYDSIRQSQCSSKDIINTEGASTTTATTRFIVCSARPSYTTSDDQLVAWAQADSDLAKKSIYVTSDRGLKDRLKEAGAFIVKPKGWLLQAVKVVCDAQGWPQDMSLDYVVDRFLQMDD